MQTAAVAKDLMFKMRLDAQDRERLDAVAAHYSAPAATAIRILIKEKFDAIQGARSVRLERMHIDVLSQLGDEPTDVGEIGLALNRMGYDARMTGLGRVLNELRREGLVQKLRAGYVLTAKGRTVE